MKEVVNMGKRKQLEGYPKKCPILPNWMTKKDGTCKRYIICQMQGRTSPNHNPRCPAKGQA